MSKTLTRKNNPSMTYLDIDDRKITRKNSQNCVSIAKILHILITSTRIYTCSTMFLSYSYLFAAMYIESRYKNKKNIKKLISISHIHECLLLYASLADTVENNNDINRHLRRYHHRSADKLQYIHKPEYSLSSSLIHA